jgi:hypothetical protein
LITLQTELYSKKCVKEKSMCTASVGNILVYDDHIQELMNKPIMDIVHKQVVMTLYSLALSKQLDNYEKLLPVYLGIPVEECRAILGTIEQAGLIEIANGRIRLTHPIQPDASDPCACGH